MGAIRLAVGISTMGNFICAVAATTFVEGVHRRNMQSTHNPIVCATHQGPELAGKGLASEVAVK